MIELRGSARAERRVAIVLFNFPPNGGNTGTAAYLAVFDSLFNTLKAMKADGYSVDLPASSEELRQRIVEGNAAAAWRACQCLSAHSGCDACQA